MLCIAWEWNVFSRSTIIAERDHALGKRQILHVIHMVDYVLELPLNFTTLSLPSRQ